MTHKLPANHTETIEIRIDTPKASAEPAAKASEPPPPSKQASSRTASEGTAPKEGNAVRTSIEQRTTRSDEECARLNQRFDRIGEAYAYQMMGVLVAIVLVGLWLWLSERRRRR